MFIPVASHCAFVKGYQAWQAPGNSMLATGDALNAALAI